MGMYNDTKGLATSIRNELITENKVVLVKWITIVTNYDSTSHNAAMRGLPLPVTDTNIVGSEKKFTMMWKAIHCSGKCYHSN